ncbi:MAG: D-cysteine desulfhydrase [Alphaproteobacteria bacterium]|nr:D-cysteine desulfhydrase [Alphaproteobacteria bacterium]
MRLFDFPRRRYTPHATPLEPARRLSAHLGGPDIWFKRDDLLGLAGGGNKTRKLEFLVADALAHGADTLITVGAVQSNHCRLTAAAAAAEGLKCRLILEERVPNSYRPGASGNNLLFHLLGVEAIDVVPAGTDLAARMEQEAAAVAALGRKAYVLPGGGSNARGALGYAACAQELMQQAFELGVRLDQFVCASGSAGTHAGLVAGLAALDARLPVTGVSVRRPRGEQEPNVHKLAVECATLLGAAAPAREAVVVEDGYVGAGYSLPTDEMIEAVRMVASLEGVLLDPVYTGKAMAGLIGLIRQGRFKKGETVVFLHTGGAPSLSAFADVFLA